MLADRDDAIERINEIQMADFATDRRWKSVEKNKREEKFNAEATVTQKACNSFQDDLFNVVHDWT